MTKPLRPDRPISYTDRVAAKVSLVAGATFTVLLLGLHLVEPEYDPTWRFVSEYALGHAGWMMTLAFLALAAALISTALSIVRHVQTVLGRLGLAVIALAASGFLLAATFRTDPMTTAPDAYTTSMQLHVLGASLDYSPIGMLLAGWGLSRTNGWRHLPRRLLLIAGLPFLLMISLIVALPRDGHFGPGVYAGLIARFLLLSYLVWTTTIAGAVLHHADSRASDSTRRRFRLELENRHSRRGAGAVHRAESHGLVEESLAGSHGDRMDP
jgi:Protein of unknown function (DUF998)